MWEYAAGIGVILLYLASICLALWLFVRRSGESCAPVTVSLVLPLGSRAAAVEGLLREAHRMLDGAALYDAQILLVDCGMDAQTRQICVCFCAEQPAARLIRPNELPAAVIDPYEPEKRKGDAKDTDVPSL